ncbi:VOC family protein [Williamsia maris]|uniref:VOC domain-containing protein n=1 Tax=Williamsia maris TaxID=72806 RepID=A0ABT1HDJ2_9NOCA|nr:VOC family protein [Williamsia maris]MCP2176318.1 hypothetical protein [Williamsia maris]
MSRMLFVNLPVADVAASRTFFTGLGLTVNEAFSDENTVSLVLNDQCTIMLLNTPRFIDFIVGDICDTASAHEVLLAISADRRDEVDELTDTALAAGGSVWKDPQDHGFMYGRSFRDIDGHVWEVVWMDPSAISGES